MSQSAKAHWEGVYAAKTDQELSWTQADVRTSLSLIAKFAPLKCRIIDVGGGSSPLAGRLLDMGYTVAVLDISGAALSPAAKAVGKRSGEVRWIEAELRSTVCLVHPACRTGSTPRRPFRIALPAPAWRACIFRRGRSGST